MPWRNAHALQVFAPDDGSYRDNWVVQILGTTAKPLYQQYRDDIRWLWVTRYSGPYSEDNPPVGCRVPEGYLLGGYYRYVLFRASIEGQSEESFYDQAIRLAGEAGCYTDPRGWIDYDIVADLGCNRFIRAEANFEERAERARLVVHFVDATVRLMLDLLIHTEDGIWRFEQSTHPQNPNGLMLESVHHLFCNATCVPTTVLLSLLGCQLQITTHWMEKPLTKLLGLDPGRPWQEVPLQY